VLDLELREVGAQALGQPCGRVPELEAVGVQDEQLHCRSPIADCRF